MRRRRRDRGRPIPRGDLDRVALFRAELGVMARLMERGKTRAEARSIVWAEYLYPPEETR